jgi:iron transport multicopper oxidase
MCILHRSQVLFLRTGHEFTYAFNAQGQAGTYLFHSHYSTQYCDGLRGPLVIYDPCVMPQTSTIDTRLTWIMLRNDPYKHMYDVDNADTVITLADWYHKPSPQHITTDSPDSTLINGLGRAWTNTTNTPLSVVSVNEGRRYRLRLVSMSCDPAFVFSIDGHNLTIIEVDGTLHQPYTVDSLTIFAGQRYSMILAATQPVNSYWIRALPVGTTVSLAQPFAGGINSGILRYVGAKVIEPTTAQQPSRIPLVESKLVPYRNAAAPGGPALDAPDVYALNLDFSTNFSDFRFAVNGAERDLPSVPVLLQILSGARSAEDIAPAGSYFSLPPNTVVQLSFPAGDVAAVGNHPMHLHGHTFSVVRSAGQAAHEANFVNPPQRDVVAMGSASDNVTIRFVTDNAGPWLLHWQVNARTYLLPHMLTARLV